MTKSYTLTPKNVIGPLSLIGDAQGHLSISPSRALPARALRAVRYAAVRRKPLPVALPDKNALSLISHHALAGVEARHIRELAFEGGGGRPAVEPSLFDRGGDQRNIQVRSLYRSTRERNP